MKPFQVPNDLLTSIHTIDIWLRASLLTINSVNTLTVLAASTAVHESSFDFSHGELLARLCCRGKACAVKSKHAYPAGLSVRSMAIHLLESEKIPSCESCSLVSLCLWA